MLNVTLSAAKNIVQDQMPVLVHMYKMARVEMPANLLSCIGVVSLVAAMMLQLQGMNVALGMSDQNSRRPLLANTAL